jgi:hypothetical protein
MILGKNFLALSGAILILLQCVVATGMGITANDTRTLAHLHEVESGNEVTFQTKYLETTKRSTFSAPSFLLFPDLEFISFPRIKINSYKHYKDLQGHAYSFNWYYTHLTALAP